MIVNIMECSCTDFNPVHLFMNSGDVKPHPSDMFLGVPFGL